MAVDCLRRSAGGEVVCLTDLLHAETLAKLGYEGHRCCQASGLCNFLLETVSVFFTDAAHQRAASATREDCERLRKAFRISPWRICYRLEGSKEPCRIFSHPNAIPQLSKNWRYRFCYEEEERTRKFAFLRQQRAVQ